MQQDLSWKQLIHRSNAELGFALQATTDTAPTATNLRRWGLSQVDPACILCGKAAPARHIPNGCSVAFPQGWFTCRHNSVLSAIKHRMTTFSEQRVQQQQSLQAIVSATAKGKPRVVCFVRPGEILPRNAHPCKPLTSQAVLIQTDDWKFFIDLQAQLQFPVEIAAKTLRPDVVIFSRSKKTVFILELTVPLEDKSGSAHDSENHKILWLWLCLRKKWLQNALLCFGSRTFGVLSPFTALLPWSHWSAEINIETDLFRGISNRPSVLVHFVPSKRYPNLGEPSCALPKFCLWLSFFPRPCVNTAQHQHRISLPPPETRPCSSNPERSVPSHVRYHTVSILCTHLQPILVSRHFQPREKECYLRASAFSFLRTFLLLHDAVLSLLTEVLSWWSVLF